MGLKNMFSGLSNKKDNLDVALSDLTTDMQYLKMEQRKVQREIVSNNIKIDKAMKYKQECYVKVRELVGEGNADEARNLVAEMQRQEDIEKEYSTKIASSKRLILGYDSLIVDVSDLRKAVMDKIREVAFNPDVYNMSLGDVVSNVTDAAKIYGNYDKVKTYAILEAHREQEALKTEAESEMFNAGLYDVDTERILADISSNPDIYSTELQDAYKIVNDSSEVKEYS